MKIASAETGILMASPSETTLIVLGTATSVGLINSESAQFWQIVTALGLTITPLLAKLGKRLGSRIDRATPLAAEPFDEGQPRAIIIGFGRVGRMGMDGSITDADVIPLPSAEAGYNICAGPDGATRDYGADDAFPIGAELKNTSRNPSAWDHRPAYGARSGERAVALAAAARALPTAVCRGAHARQRCLPAP